MQEDFIARPPAGSERTSAQAARFGVFELDFKHPELRRKGRIINLSQQSLVLLIYLVENAGKVATREELQKALWPAGTFVEFELALYTAMNRLRRDLGDSAAEPLFIETVPKRGYRFIAPVEFIAAAEPEIPALPRETAAALPPDVPVPAPTIEITLADPSYRRLFFAAAAISILLAMLAAYALFVAHRSNAEADH